MKRKQLKIGRSFNEWVVGDYLKDNEEAQLEFLKAAFEENEDHPEAILLAIRYVVEARGFTNVSREADITRESLYRMLSKTGNPRWDSVHKLLSALNMKLLVASKTGTEG